MCKKKRRLHQVVAAHSEQMSELSRLFALARSAAHVFVLTIPRASPTVKGSTLELNIKDGTSYLASDNFRDCNLTCHVLDASTTNMLNFDCIETHYLDDHIKARPRYAAIPMEFGSTDCIREQIDPSHVPVSSSWKAGANSLRVEVLAYDAAYMGLSLPSARSEHAYNTESDRWEADHQPQRTLVATTDEQHVTLIMDSGATVSIVNDRTLLRGIKSVSQVNISGVGSKMLQAHEEGALGPFGQALFVPESKRNILSLGVLSRHLEITYVSAPPTATTPRVLGAYEVKINDFYLYFYHSPDSLYTLSLSRTWLLHRGPWTKTRVPPAFDATVFVAVNVYNSDVPLHFTKAELERARDAGRLHRALHHPCDRYLSVILDNGTMMHVHITSVDLRNFRRINGPCKGCQMGKSKLPSSQPVATTTAGLGELLMMDIFFFYGAAGRKEPYIISVESRTGHIITARIPGKSADVLISVITGILNFYKSKRLVVKTIRTDREATLLACETALQALGVTMQRTGTGCHVKQAERAIQSVKSKCRATKAGLGCPLPSSIHQYLVTDVVAAMNDTVNVNTVSLYS